MSDGLDREVTDRELAGVGIGVGVFVTIGGALVLLDRGVSFGAVAFTGGGITCLVLGRRNRRGRHNPDELQRYNAVTFGRWVGAVVRRVRWKR